MTADPGVELLGEPHAEASVLLEMFLAGKVMGDAFTRHDKEERAA